MKSLSFLAWLLVNTGGISDSANLFKMDWSASDNNGDWCAVAERC